MSSNRGEREDSAKGGCHTSSECNSEILLKKGFKTIHIGQITDNIPIDDLYDLSFTEDRSKDRSLFYIIFSACIHDVHCQ